MCDPCQDDRYAVPITIGSETRQIWVSDFVLPAYWVAGAPGPYSFMDTIDEPWGISRNGGGLRLMRAADGTVTSDFGRHVPGEDLVRAMRARGRPAVPVSPPRPALRYRFIPPLDICT